MNRFLQVMGAETFRLEVPVDAKVWIGPLVPAEKNPLPEGVKINNFYMQRDGYERTTLDYALHVEAADGTKLAMIPGVKGFRDLDVNYTAKVTSEEGATIWKSDKDGYKREENVRRAETWTKEDLSLLPLNEQKKKPRK